MKAGLSDFFLALYAVGLWCSQAVVTAVLRATAMPSKLLHVRAVGGGGRDTYQIPPKILLPPTEQLSIRFHLLLKLEHPNLSPSNSKRLSLIFCLSELLFSLVTRQIQARAIYRHCQCPKWSTRSHCDQTSPETRLPPTTPTRTPIHRPATTPHQNPPDHRPEEQLPLRARRKLLVLQTRR